MMPPELDFLKLAVNGVRGLNPYQAGKPIEELEREYGVTDIVKLASNENPLGPSPKALNAIALGISDLARYPDGNGFSLKKIISERLDVAPTQIILGNGSSDALEFVVRALASRGDEIIFSQHSFAMYPLMTQMVDAKPVVTPAKNWGHDLAAMLKAITAKTKIIFIANPNNPTGTWLTASALQSFIRQVPPGVIVVIDEAYYEYVQEQAYSSMLSLLSSTPNLMITRTFSKAYGLAGLRVGFGLCHPALAGLLNRIRPPFNVNSMALAAAQVALTDAEHIDHSLRINTQGMLQLTHAFNALGLEFIPSVGNFVAVNVQQDENRVYEKLLRQGVIVRPVGNYQMPGFLRITIGLENQNRRFIEALNNALNNVS